MARVHSTMVALGKKAPGFLLPDMVSEKQISLNDVHGEPDSYRVATVVMFI
jgi:hypothetical protein